MYDMNKWEKAVSFHGHRCAGLAIGFRVCEALTERFGAAFSKDEELVCITENDTCAADAVQSLLGCTFGKGNLIYRSRGKMAFNFYFRESGQSIRLYFKGDLSRLPADARMEYVLNAPANDLFHFTEPAFPIPSPARRFRSVACTACGELVREDRIRLRDGSPYCLGCYEEYDR